ncbi:hypothetical protein [Streptomyces sp. NBC_01236]|nr:hypothetical protein OG324_30980 [Streptomyces sp. NBC_01236]
MAYTQPNREGRAQVNVILVILEGLVIPEGLVILEVPVILYGRRPRPR